MMTRDLAATQRYQYRYAGAPHITSATSTLYAALPSWRHRPARRCTVGIIIFVL